MSNNLEQKYYEGFIKAAVVNGLSFPQAINLYKQGAGGLNELGPLLDKALETAKPATQSLEELGLNAPKPNFSQMLGQNPGMLAGGAAAGGAGLGAGAAALLGGHGGAGAPPGAAPSMKPSVGPATDQHGMPEWAKWLLAGGAGGLGVGGAMAMMPQQQEEKQQQSLLPHPPIA